MTSVIPSKQLAIKIQHDTYYDPITTPYYPSMDHKYYNRLWFKDNSRYNYYQSEIISQH